MVRTSAGWPRSDIFLVTFVSVAILLSIIGCTLVMNEKRGGGRHLMALMEGAYTGGIIAMSAAALVCLAAIFLKNRDAIGVQLVLSVLILLLTLWAIFALTRRIDSGYEPFDDGVIAGQRAYIAAAVLQTAAAVIGIIRLRRLKSATPEMAD